MGEQFILAPARGLRGEVSVPTVTTARPGRFRKVDEALHMERFEGPGGEALQKLSVKRVKARVLDEIEDGPKLIEIPSGALAKAMLSAPDNRYLPVREYEPATVKDPVSELPPGAQTAAATDFDVRCAKSAAPIEGAKVTALVDRGRQLGDSGVSSRDGRVSLRLGPAPLKLERLQVEPPRHGWWGACNENLPITGSQEVQLTPIDLEAQPLDSLRYFYGKAPKGGNGGGVKIGVIDTGIDDRANLTVSGGCNTVKGEDEDLYRSNGIDHGTHVAGIIAANGTQDGLRGLAPEAELLSFRVYGEGLGKTSNFSISKAMDRAIGAKCDLINLSLECPEDDVIIAEWVDEAHVKGIVVIGAAGNGGPDQEVVSPARYGTAVTALGRLHTFPAGSLESGYIGDSKGSDPDNFLAEFCNVGPDVGLTAPGLGVVSTVPGGYAPASGTSMAAAAATGMAARLLSANPQVLAMPRNRKRFEAMQNLINANATDVGFGFSGQGYGMLGQ